MEFSELARLPDCAQDRRCETSDVKETHWADDVSEETEAQAWYEPLTGLADCYYCGCERTIGLNDGDYPTCESCATLEKEERDEVRRNRDDQPIPYVLTSKSKDNRYGPDSEAPCPHPEWEGIWKTQYGTIVYARWVHDNGKSMWKIKECASTSWGYWDGPSHLWTLIEPAPYASRPGPKLERPKKHGGIKTPWDPWEI
jgi:hypothetical protein